MSANPMKDGETFMRLGGDLARVEKQFRECLPAQYDRAREIMREAGDRWREHIDKMIAANASEPVAPPVASKWPAKPDPGYREATNLGKAAPESKGLDLDAAIGVLSDLGQEICEDHCDHYDNGRGESVHCSMCNQASELRKILRRLRAGAEGEGMGYALAMRVRQSDLYALLDDTEQAECDALIQAEARRLRSSGRAETGG